MNEKIREVFINFWDRLIEMTPNLLAAILVSIVFILLGRLVYNLINKRLAKRWGDSIVTQFSGNVLKWILYLIGLLTVLDIMNLGGLVSGLMTGAGITAIILGFAFKDIGENFLAGFLLAVNRPFRIGNIIQVNNFKGVVKGMDMRTTHIRNVEGKDIYIPNSMIVKEVVVNYTKDGLLRQEFEIGFDVPTKVDQAKILILDYISKQPDVLKTPVPNVITVEVGEFTVNVKVLFWVNVLKNKNTSPTMLGLTIRSKVINEIKDLLLSNGFNLPSQILEHKNYSEPIIIQSKKD